MNPREQIRQLMLAVNVIDGVFAQQCKEIGIKENTASLLYALDDGQAHSQKEISEKWLIPKTTLNTIVKECEASELVILEAGRGKEKLIRITLKGKRYANEVLSLIYETEQAALEKTLADCSPEFIEAMTAYASHIKNETTQFIPRRWKSQHL